MKILVTGAAGFIGSKLAYRLAQRGDEVVGLDNINDYYDVRLKLGRLTQCGIISHSGRYIDGSIRESTLFPNYRFIKMDLADRGQMTEFFRQEKFNHQPLRLSGQQPGGIHERTGVLPPQ